MEELIHIPYGACIITASGDIKNRITFFNNDSHTTFNNFFNYITDMTDEETAYLYFMTIEAKNLTNIQPGTTYGIFTDKMSKYLFNSFYAEYGIYVYSISKDSPIYSHRINHFSKNPETVSSVLKNLCDNAVAPSHITEVLEGMNEKTPA